MGRSGRSEGRSSIGRAPVSKTGGCRFKSCRPCARRRHQRPPASTHRRPRRTREQLDQHGASDARPPEVVKATARRVVPSPGSSRFVREIIAELRKVLWPSRNELVTYTIVVIVFVVIMVRVVAGLDIGFAKLVSRCSADPAAARSTRPGPPRGLPERKESYAVSSRTRPASPRGRAARRRAAGPAAATRPTSPAPTPRGRAPPSADVRSTVRPRPPRLPTPPRPPSRRGAAADRPTRSCRRRGRRGRRRPLRPPSRPTAAETRPTRTRTRSRRCAASCAPPSATGTSCTPTPATRTR